MPAGPAPTTATRSGRGPVPAGSATPASSSPGRVGARVSRTCPADPTPEENLLSITIVATISPKPGRADAVREAFTAAIPKVHEESGCELYALHEDGYGFVM